MAGKKFKCVKAWARNKKDDVIMDWELKRYPPEIQKNNFIEYVPEEIEEKVLTSKPFVNTPKHQQKPLIADSKVSKPLSNESIISE